ncbi:glycerophosphodiester phosphodiesterase [Salinisphaera hydrothermalis]|uniref:Glycerophosphoryl diester phosphodiesterase n=1 Tax=Salinisphaera hydrothermalis (strain C41B8) TaxID=1304275 RepID=A0A084IH15_SALHC|nr:glycerophosphodiester phosphodiesterase family protein [Salinisphaera hydrothermalis]KEZ75999.1 glycerophosphoryl diester phosphodiesterase [Salinisphaera hydrothermalis C41B8]
MTLGRSRYNPALTPPAQAAVHPFVEDALLWIAEAALAYWPRDRPTSEQLARAMIVAHRGERDGIRVKENTLAAFDPVVAAGVAAIEFDVRYTADDEPVVVHDADLARVFGRPERIDALDWATLHRRVPEVPHLADIIARYADRAHLMIELKARGSARAEARLREHLRGLTPGAHYHVLALDPALFAAVAELPAAALAPVAKANWETIRDWSQRHDCGGIAGPFPFIRRADIRDCQRADRWIGSGFISRPGLMRREIGRDIPWIFTNRPLALQRALDRARRRSRR